MNSHLQCAAQKILLFIANEPISQATNLFRQLQSLIPLSFENRFAKPFRLRKAEKKSVFRKSIASRPDPSLVSLYLSQKIFTEKQFLF